MTDIHTTTRTEAGDVAELAAVAATPHELEPGQIYGIRGADGVLHVTDTEAHANQPRRKRGTVTAADAASFVAYVKKHGLDQTEVWAHAPTSQLVAVINAHQGTTSDGFEDRAGWGDHRVRLGLVHTPAWVAWTGQDRKLLSQVDFAEHLEDRLADIVEPAAAEMLELAQTFSAKRSVDFESSRRLRTGETTLVYKEEDTAAAGRKGDIAIPDTFTLALRPYEGGDPYRVTARLRYRIADGHLRLGYILDRPDEVLRAAFDDLVNVVHTELDQPVWNGTP